MWNVAQAQRWYRWNLQFIFSLRNKVFILHYIINIITLNSFKITNYLFPTIYYAYRNNFQVMNCWLFLNKSRWKTDILPFLDFELPVFNRTGELTGFHISACKFISGSMFLFVPIVIIHLDLSYSVHETYYAGLVDSIKKKTAYDIPG